MDPREYADARWHALLRAADELGVPPEDATGVVRAVLARNERRIRRAEDPDPLVHQALREAVLGAPRPGRRRWPVAVALAAVLVAVCAGVVITRPDPLPTEDLRGDQVPSLFGYDGKRAEQLLEDRGLDVTTLPFRSCEVMNRVVGSDPPAGTPYDRGDSITVYTALPADVVCLTDYQDRVTAWRLLDFANGRGPAPEFADRVLVYPGDGPTLSLSREEAADPGSWTATGVLQALRTASARVTLVGEHPVSYAIPAVRVTRATDGLGVCGVPEPSVAGTGNAFALIVRPPDNEGCGLRVDVYREGADYDGAIEAVALYPTLS